MTKEELENNILAAVEELRVARSQLEPLATEWAVADQKYRKAQAVALLQAEGTIPEKKAHVDRVCSNEMYAAHSADALREAAKLNVGAIQAELSAYQTLARVMVAEMGLAGRYE